MDPAAEVKGVVDPVHHPEGLHEGLLGDVLGQQGVAELAPDEPVDRGDVAAVELLERVDVALAIGTDKIHVSRLARRPCLRLVFLYVVHA